MSANFIDITLFPEDVRLEAKAILDFLYPAYEGFSQDKIDIIEIYRNLSRISSSFEQSLDLYGKALAIGLERYFPGNYSEKIEIQNFKNLSDKDKSPYLNCILDYADLHKEAFLSAPDDMLSSRSESIKLYERFIEITDDVSNEYLYYPDTSHNHAKTSIKRLKNGGIIEQVFKIPPFSDNN